MASDSGDGLVIGKHYEYFGQRVQLVEANLYHHQCTVESSFGDRTTCDVDELSDWPDRPSKLATTEQLP